MGTDANKRYDHPDFTITRVASYTSVAGASLIGARLHPYINAKLIACHVKVSVEGTAISNMILQQVTAGTTTTALATYAITTSTMGVESSVTALDATLALGDEVSFINSTEATGVVDVTYEYRLTPGGTFST